MSESFKLGEAMAAASSQALSSEPVSAETCGSRTPDEPGPAICYRMDSEKRLLGNRDCGSACSSFLPAQGNQIPPCLLSEQQHTVIDLEGTRRVALMVTPQISDSVTDQAWEAVSTIRAILKQQRVPMTVTLQTVFLRSPADVAPCRKLFEAYYGDRMPATNFVLQPPCGGQALAIEAWALGGAQAQVKFHEPDVISVAYDGLRWIHVAGVSPASSVLRAYDQSKLAFAEMNRRLHAAGATFRDVVRTWLYQGGIVETIPHVDDGIERYRELNRARTDFFDELQARGEMAGNGQGRTYYPASTGIGTQGRGLTISCLGLQTERDDVRLVPLENPQQTSAFDYARQYSPKSPKFSRAMAVVIGDYVTTWVSGTASIVNSESVHLGDVEKQTEQTIDNIERLISGENFERHGLPGSGARLSDLAKVRVYVKRLEDFEKCQAICDRRFGRLPTVYALADVCRSDLLVEIEGVAFHR